jgi:hypothetical protein
MGEVPSEHLQKRRLEWWRWASDRWTGRGTVVLLAVLLRILFPGIWTSWLGSAVIILLLIFAFLTLVSVAIRAYQGKE